jgi:acyl-CoA synthetase (AMP-forming)/AMP-acid ligase II
MLARWRGCADPAVIAGDTTWSGDDLMMRAAGAATHLRSLTRREGPIPALVASTAPAFAYVVGGASARRPLAPLGPRMTKRELAPCIDALASDVILTDPEFETLAAALTTGRDIQVVVIGEPGIGDATTLELDPPADATAFVLHTSGTTGTPSAVPYTQGRLALRTGVNAQLCALGPGAVYATASPFHHIAGFGNYAVALAAGATLVPMPRFTVDSWKALGDLGVTNALTVPTMLEMLLDAGALALPALRVLQYGGSPIHPETLRRTLVTIPEVRLVNIYGQTEGSPITCLTGDDHLRIDAEGRVDLLDSSGRAAPGVALWIDDADERGVGEVCARAEHFFLPGADGVVRTGDVGRLDDDGYLFLVGRRGDKIIRGGENVYPLEVERVLEEHPAVREAAVVGVAHQRWGESVKAVIVAADPARLPSVDELRAHARRSLAGFKVPTEWAFVDALPRNHAGKLLRRAITDAAPARPRG